MNVAIDVGYGKKSNGLDMVLACDTEDGQMVLLNLEDLTPVKKIDKNFQAYSASYFAHRFYEMFLKGNSFRQNIKTICSKVRHCDFSV